MVGYLVGLMGGLIQCGLDRCGCGCGGDAGSGGGRRLPSGSLPPGSSGLPLHLCSSPVAFFVGSGGGGDAGDGLGSGFGGGNGCLCSCWGKLCGSFDWGWKNERLVAL